MTSPQSPLPACPTCGRPIDPLRAPVARISGGRIVTYCTPACARGKPAAQETAGFEGTKSEVSVLPARTEPTPPTPVESQGARVPVLEPPPPVLVPPAMDRATVVPPPAVVRHEDTAVPGEPQAAATPAPSAFGARRRVGVAALVASALVLFGAGVFVMRRHQSVNPPPTRVAPVLEMQAPSSAIAISPAPRPVDRATVLREARETLVSDLSDASPRVRRLAAQALSRTRDPRALEELRKALAREESEITKLEVAHSLARAGEASGYEHLVNALRSPRRDVRLQAARGLASLGDPRGKDRLKEALSINTLRLGAAEALALLGDEPAISILKEALAGKNAEAQMRAAVALGRAGDPSGLEWLKAMTAGGKVELGAATALARFDDPAALPALVRALELTALRHEAAIALRRMGADVDPGPLAAALVAGDELARTTAAEAILILYDEERPAELAAEVPAPSPASAAAPAPLNGPAGATR
ncbi:MAG: HEAT repeat domain-containing protein [Deltaproteobacteria bacterium]|nr:HEAT repeat domain-containing protein [Deltaproteobacteria bacterium]